MVGTSEPSHLVPSSRNFRKQNQMRMMIDFPSSQNLFSSNEAGKNLPFLCLRNLGLVRTSQPHSLIAHQCVYLPDSWKYELASTLFHLCCSSKKLELVLLVIAVLLAYTRTETGRKVLVVQCLQCSFKSFTLKKSVLNCLGPFANGNKTLKLEKNLDMGLYS